MTSRKDITVLVEGVLLPDVHMIKTPSHMVAAPIDFGASQYTAVYTFRILTLTLMSFTIVAGSVAAFGDPPTETTISQCVSQKEKVD